MAISFTAKTLSFLRSLKRNNKREWFHARRDQYDAHVRALMHAIVEQLAVDLRSCAPELIADPKVSLFRPFRDTRFSEDKTPLKTHVAATFPNRRLGRLNGASFYLEVGPTYVWLGGGLYAPDSSQLYSVREHIAKHYRQLDKIVRSPDFKALGGLQGEKLKGVPRGFDKEHKAATYLRHRQFLIFREEPAAFATSKDFYKNLLSTIKTTAPLMRFLNEPLIAAQSVSRKAHILDEE